MVEAIESADVNDYPASNDNRSFASQAGTEIKEPARKYKSEITDTSNRVVIKQKANASQVKSPTTREGTLSSA